MENFKNCVFFTLKLGIVAGLISSVCLSFRQILAATLSTPFMESIHVIYYSSFLGLAAGFLGYWLVYPVRNSAEPTFKAFSGSVAMIFAALILQFTRTFWQDDPTFQIIFYPIIPVFLCVVAFTRLAKMHLFDE